MKYKKEVLLSVGALLTIVSVVKLAPSQDYGSLTASAYNTQAMLREHEEASIVAYEIEYNGIELGFVKEQSEVERVVTAAYDKLVAEIGYDPEISIEPALVPIRGDEISAEELALYDENALVDNVKLAMIDSLETILQKAYVMRIGDDFTVALKDEAAVKEVLLKAQSHFLNLEVKLDIALTENKHNAMVLNPKVLMVDPSSAEMALSTAAPEAGKITSEDAATTSVTEEVEAITTEVEATTSEVDATTTADTTEVAVEPGKMIDIQFAEDIAVVPTFVDPTQIYEVDEAVAMITKENEESQIYNVVQGDCPSTIATDHDMKLADLYAMNPELENGNATIHIGDPIVVMVPEPELKVETQVEIVYTEPVARATTYVDDPNSYVGNSATVSEGSDGVKEITAVITKLNGEEVERTVTQETVLEEPVAKVVSKGSKAFPVKGATGSYTFPVSGYRISSNYGYRWGSFHHGVDLACSKGTSIKAADGGTVIFAGWKSSTYGYFVEIDHGDGITTRYAHCSSVDVEVGDKVA
ncbi:MAG: M23 family metallopeptidase, partial [Vallitaleaceae bacterium]|nr:M23 family metallopeptidase [Vallitaleaceae bacterium]